jgi:CarD family transcriptional regulator
MPAKKNKKISSAKKTVTKKTVKKPAVKKPTVKKPVAKKPVAKKSPEKKSAAKKAPKKIVTKKAPAPKKEVKKASKVKAQKASPKKETPKKKAEISSKKVEAKKPEKKSDKHSLAKAILARGSSKEKITPETKSEAEKPAEKKFDSAKKIILVRKGEDNTKLNFKVGDYAIYPSHGVGKIAGIEKTSIAGQEFSCYLMSFEREKLTIKIPASSAKKIGLRHPISKTEMDEVFSILRSGIKKLKGMWSRRAQEYETKINSGDIILLAEVIRDLTRDIEDSERSYSERIIYETAIYRLASEYAAIYKVDLEEAKEKIITTAKDKLSGEPRSTNKDDFDDFDDFDREKSDGEDDEEESDEDEEEEDEDDDFDFDDEDDDDAPKKRKKRK